MNKVLLTMALMLALGVGQITAQKNRHAQPATVQVDTVSQNAVDLFSDTTAVDTASSRNIQVNVNLDDLDDTGFGNMFRFVFSNADADGIMGMAFVLCILLILFVLAPLLIIIALFYFINKNRKDRLRLAQMAVQNGQPIPEQLLKNNTVEGPDDEYQKGMRQCFVGVGLMIFLGYAAGNVGFGVGALVFCIGLGKVFAAWTARKNSKRDWYNDNTDNNI